MRRNERQLRPLGKLFFFGALLNFMVFMAVAAHIGGDAHGGKIEAGHYYVSNHGHLTEVSARVWRYSWWHRLSVWITHPLGIIGAFLFSVPKRYKYIPTRRGFRERLRPRR